MTISITKTKKQYAGDGTTTNFIYDFEIEKDEDLKVIVRDSVGNESILVLDDDYTVAGAGNPTGGSITLASGSLCPTGSTLTLMRDTSPVQETDYITGSIFSAESMENALDKLTLLIQEGKEILGRTLVLKRSSAYKDLSLPDPDGGKYLRWNADKTGIENAGIENAGSGSTYDADKLDGQEGSYYLARANHTGTQAPTTISPQGAGSGLDADKLDGKHAQDLLDLASQWANVKDFGAVGDNATDDTAAIQAALNSTFNTIFVPAGIYRISDALTIPYGKILKGTGSPDAPQYSCTSGFWLWRRKGSVIAQTSTSHSAVIMSSKTTLDGINFWYPNQPGITTTPTEYPATIVPSDTHPTKVVINNCVLVNPYVGIDFTVLHELLTIQNVRIFAWFKCIRIDQSYDIDRLIDVHVNPNVMYDGTWTGNTAYVYTINNGCSAFEFGKADQLYVSKCFSYGYTNAILFSNLSGLPINGIIFDQCGFEFCHIIASMDQIGGGQHILFSGCFLGQLETSIHNAIHMIGTAASPINNVMFSNCVFWRTASQTYFKYVNGLAFYNCFMENLIVESSGTWFEPAISLEYCKDVKIISDTLKVATHGYNEYIRADYCENVLLRNLMLHDCQNNTQALEIFNSTNVGIKDIMCVNTPNINVASSGNTNIIIGNIWPTMLGGGVGNADTLDGWDSTDFLMKAGDTVTGGFAVKYGASNATDDQLIIGRAGSPAAGKPTIVLKINNGVARIGTWDGTTNTPIEVEAPTVHGGASGGSKGPGTINAKGVYVDGVAVGGGGNADTLDGQDSTYFLARANHTGTQAPTTISPQGAGSGLDADKLDGYHAGNASGNVPISNGTANTNLNADMVDGKHATDMLMKAGDTVTGGFAVKYGASTATDDQLIIGRAGSPAAGNPTIVLKIDNGVALIGTWDGTAHTPINVEAPLVCGGADGGNKGAGTINAKGVYDDGTLLTCYVLEAEMTGKVDLAKWDGLVLNGKDGKGKKIVRDHKPAKRFSERAADLLDPKKYAEMWRKSGYLPSMPDAEEWKAHGMKMSLGDLVQRLWETVECQSVHIDKLRKRIEELEAKHAKY